MWGGGGLGGGTHFLFFLKNLRTAVSDNFVSNVAQATFHTKTIGIFSSGSE